MTNDPTELRVETIGKTCVAFYPDDAPVIADVNGALDAMGMMYGIDAEMLVIPVTRLAPEFFVLRTRIAGEILQKFQNYGIRVAIIGDISEQLAASYALTDFARETTRRGEVLFLPALEALRARLA